MTRAVLALLLALVLAATAGCGVDGTVEETPGDQGTGAVDETPSAGAPVDGFEAIPADGPGEAAAAAAAPAALEQAKGMRGGGSSEWPDLTGAEPILTAYVVIVELNGQTALAEVRADGRPHNLYAYHKAFDAASLLWSAEEHASAPRSAPQSEREGAAVSAVEAAMADSFPEGGFSVRLYGYRFVYMSAQGPVLTLEVGTDGSVLSVGT